jgi:biotin operon repressor
MHDPYIPFINTRQVSPFDVAVYRQLERLSEETGYCCISNPKLASILGSTAARVSRAIHRLELNGCIIVADAHARSSKATKAAGTSPGGRFPNVITLVYVEAGK